MAIQAEITPTLTEAFTEAMARLVAGVAVVTGQQIDGSACGLLVSSICSYSLRPPSILVSIGQESRCYRAVTSRPAFGVHLLAATDESVARTFASRDEDKFSGLDWGWEDDVPRLFGTPVYLRCSRSQVFVHGDHAIIIGEVAGVEIKGGEPLVYYRRALSWRLRGPAQQG